MCMSCDVVNRSRSLYIIRMSCEKRVNISQYVICASCHMSSISLYVIYMTCQNRMNRSLCVMRVSHDIWNRFQMCVTHTHRISDVFQMCVIHRVSDIQSIKLQVSFAKEPYNRDYILQKRPIDMYDTLCVIHRVSVTVCHLYVRHK